VPHASAPRLAHNSAWIVFLQRPNCAVETLQFRLFAISTSTVWNCFATPKKKSCSERRTGTRWRRYLARTAPKRGCAVQKGKRLSRRGRADGMERPPVRKELPMEFSASVTAVMAIVSFGFLAAILLGMI